MDRPTGLAARTSLLLGVLGASLALTACSSGPSAVAPAPDQGGIVAESAPPTSSVLAEKISIDVASRLEFVRWSEVDDPSQSVSDSTPSRRVMVVTREAETPHADHDGQYAPGMPARAWKVRRFLLRPGDPAGEGSAGRLIREMRVVSTEGGGLAISEEINHVEGVRVEFTPPMYILPGELPLDGEQCVYENIKMVVRPIDRPDRIRAQGIVRHVVCYEADEVVRTPAGLFRAHRIMSRFEADLGGSKIENVTHQWFVPGVGLVAERRHETTKAVGFTIRNNREDWIVRGTSRSGIE